MKRVLNNGSIKLINVLGSEQDFIQLFKIHFDDRELDEMGGNPAQEKIVEYVCNVHPYHLSHVRFSFEIKAPISLLSIWHKSKLGTVNEYGQLHVDEVYIPPFFYKRDAEGFTQLEPKDCNDLFTKFNNYYTASVNFYHKLLERGLCKEQAQLVLPSGLFATFTWVVDAKDLMTFIEKNHSVSPEFYGYCEVFHVYLKETMPKVMEWIQQNKPII